ncbi:hypothetical protein LINPERPRIM_LOCUS32845, partial [Linum perenne]
VVLNTDGFVHPNSGNAATGGLVRNELGFCLTTFSLSLGKCSIMRVELRGIISGFGPCLGSWLSVSVGTCGFSGCYRPPQHAWRTNTSTRY